MTVMPGEDKMHDALTQRRAVALSEFLKTRSDPVGDLRNALLSFWPNSAHLRRVVPSTAFLRLPQQERERLIRSNGARLGEYAAMQIDVVEGKLQRPTEDGKAMQVILQGDVEGGYVSLSSSSLFALNCLPSANTLLRSTSAVETCR